MFRLRDVVRPPYKEPTVNWERLRIVNTAERDYPGYATGLLDARFDPAFLKWHPDPRTRVAVGVYCADLATEVLRDAAAGLGAEHALEDLHLILDTFPEHHTPLLA